MPYILIQVTREGVTQAQKRRLIADATDMVANVLNKDPATTFVVIDEVDTGNWGVAGRPVTDMRAGMHQYAMTSIFPDRRTP